MRRFIAREVSSNFKTFALLRSTVRWAPGALIVASGLFGAVAVAASGEGAVVSDFRFMIVDKSKNLLHLMVDRSSGMEIMESYKVTLGKAVGDKTIEGDLKTPEGFYRFTARYRPPQIKPKFGAMALYMNYPNPVDRLEGKTGFDIMLHATDTPERLRLNQDSDGCIVLSNEQILELEKHVRVPRTPILVYDELKPEYLAKETRAAVLASFEKWLKAWTGKDIETYIGSYASGFRSGAMDLKAYRAYKQALNKKYHEIDVDVSDVRAYYHPKYAVVTFEQKYSSKFADGKTAFMARGFKTLYFKKTGADYKIMAEDI